MKNRDATTPTSKKQDKATAEVLKIGIDVHKKQYVFVCQYDGQSPKSPQKLEPEAFLAWIAKQASRVDRIQTCYDARTGAPARLEQGRSRKGSILHPCDGR